MARLQTIAFKTLLPPEFAGLIQSGNCLPIIYVKRPRLLLRVGIFALSGSLMKGGAYPYHSTANPHEEYEPGFLVRLWYNVVGYR